MNKQLTMVRSLLTLIFVFAVVGSLCAQVPHFPYAFKYQAVVRDNAGRPIESKQVSLRINILKGSISGIVAYGETHTAITSPFGLVNLEIGNGNVLTGDVSAIDWGGDEYFLEVSLDATGGSSFSVMGTSQLLSVPYALYAKTAGNGFSGDYENLTNKPGLASILENGSDGGQRSISNLGSVSIGNGGAVSSSLLTLNSTTQGALLPRMTTSERDAITAPADGLLIFNTSTGSLNYHMGANWFELKGICTPQPSIPAAGADQIDITGTSTTLAANAPTVGEGTWTIVSGTGGGFVNPQDPNTTFSGTPGVDYELKWTISNSCGSGSDAVAVRFEEAGLKIGDSYQGGKIFYLDGQGGGLIVSSVVTSYSLWGCMGTSISGTSTDVGTGQANTNAIVSGCVETWSTPANMCANYSIEGFDDWYLPSRDELSLIYSNLVSTGKASIALSNPTFCSSSQDDANSVWRVNLSSGTIASVPKTTDFAVVAIRKF